MKTGLLIAAVIGLTGIAGSALLAQPPADGAAPGATPGAGRQARRGQMRMPITVATIPAKTLKEELKLTDEQTEKITAIQKSYTDELRTLRGPGAPGAAPGAPGAAPDPAARQKLTDLSKKTTTDIEAVLTDEQKTQLPKVITALNGLSSLGVPINLLPELKLTTEQREKFAALYKEAEESVSTKTGAEKRTALREALTSRREKATEILTTEQKDLIKKSQTRRTRGNRRNAAPGTSPEAPAAGASDAGK